MLRAAVAEGSELGRQAEPLLNAGQLVPDEIMIGLIRERLAQEDAQLGFVLDGIPRTAGQAEELDAMLGEIGRPLRIVFELHLSEAVSLERLGLRAVQEGRTDDTPEAIRTRLRLYREQTEPLVEYYRARGILVGIDADRSVEEVFAEIQKALETLSVRS
jgi:adenylate kinase